MQKKLYLVQVLIIMFVIAGCQQNEEEALESKENNQQFLQVKNSEPTDLQNLSNKEIADRLANIASDVPNVRGASAVVAGPYAVVGIDVDKDLDRSRVGTLKYSVSEALYHDPYGKTAVVVADADATERIRNMGNKIKQGHPVQGVVDELAAIVGRYMPDFPIQDDQPVDPDQNKEVLPEEEQKQLDQIQEEQSNHQKNK
ncbi:YhcN/YlaJ family sporulation lipoprotein [Virgibacillus halodenitrificans]|uniref:YhcN/YlaJ family sporulation lipoprotein n=1 Tax=Virgibacillus halodenitrificans TaxID=1482 RepID=UPI00045C4BB4|nr:YhcN/YlaJ family sporulation lipoprotein [Virgibacillus halodenitrificans]MCG1029778.1 YhcN/YlaJ family sporulation lipoprotein [Virgibacillus halodenitrificans]MCJ0931335.1 YhcN/YlaJ family sporulation lipoprotein [Virgibacillus halodenitrificans]MEC2161121.1 YhcN/YlaJ family sporulation lipoprotein [Virgibacillus halodenitrificans]CDQ35978.1 sporulation lipoprotein, YhcN/YlaJ family [Virgibacillus halodenitrificans]